jgi:hypothetical protein
MKIFFKLIPSPFRTDGTAMSISTPLIFPHNTSNNDTVCFGDEDEFSRDEFS